MKTIEGIKHLSVNQGNMIKTKPDYKAVDDMKYCKFRFWFDGKTHRFIYCYGWTDKADTHGNSIFGNDTSHKVKDCIIIEVDHR